MRNALMLLVCGASLLGCATQADNPNTGNIEILATSQGQAVQDARCTVNTATRHWDDVRPPTVVPVGAPDGTLRVACRKPGLRDSEVVYQPSPYSYAGNPNVGVGVGGGSGGGGVGVGFGFNFPIGGGAGPIGGYPARIMVEMTPQ